jgi:hypothetical protein
MPSFDEQLATAMVAKIFGTELKTVDENTLQQSSSGPAAKLDPLSFVTSVQEKRHSDQQRAVEAANREAELLYPLPQSDFTPAPTPIQLAPVQQFNVPPVQHVQPVIETAGFTKEDIQSIRSQLEKVNATLTKMSGMLGKVFATFTEKNKD